MARGVGLLCRLRSKLKVGRCCCTDCDEGSLRFAGGMDNQGRVVLRRAGEPADRLLGVDGRFYCHDRRGRYRHRYVRYIRAVCAIRDLFTCADFFSFAVISSSIFSGRDFRWKLKLPLIFMYCGSMPHAAVVLNR